MRVVILRGRVSIRPFCQEGCRDFFFRDVVRISCIFSCLSFLDTFFLYFRSCDHFYTYIVLIFFIYVDICFFHLPLTCVVSFLSLYTCFLHLYAIYYFCFTQRCFDEFCLNCFRNTGCQSLLAINTLFLQIFSRVCVRIDFIIFNK